MGNQPNRQNQNDMPPRTAQAERLPQPAPTTVPIYSDQVQPFTRYPITKGRNAQPEQFQHHGPSTNVPGSAYPNQFQQFMTYQGREMDMTPWLEESSRLRRIPDPTPFPMSVALYSNPAETFMRNEQVTNWSNRRYDLFPERPILVRSVESLRTTLRVIRSALSPQQCIGEVVLLCHGTPEGRLCLEADVDPIEVVREIANFIPLMYRRRGIRLLSCFSARSLESLYHAHAYEMRIFEIYPEQAPLGSQVSGRTINFTNQDGTFVHSALDPLEWADYKTRNNLINSTDQEILDFVMSNNGSANVH